MTVTQGATNSRIKELKSELFSEILQEQMQVMGLRDSDKDKKDLLEELLKEYEGYKGRGFFFPFMATGRGHGPFVEIVDGSVKYDLIGAIGVNLLGHSHPIYIKSCLEAAATDAIMCGNLLSYPEPYLLSKKLLEQVKDSRLKHFWFAGSGSFAGDSALKMMWQKKAPHYKLLALEKAFAGRSIATQDITYNSAYRDGMPKTVDVFHAPNFDPNHPDTSLKTTLDGLEKLWSEHKGEFCGLTLELVQGEAGFIFGTHDYYRGVCEWAKAKGIYIWFDEVQTFARTRELFAFQYFKLDQYADVVTIGKALQACGTLFTEELNPRPGLIAGTFNGALSGLKAGEKTIRLLTEGPFYGPHGRMAELETKFVEALDQLSSELGANKVSGARGLGTMISFQVGAGDPKETASFLKDLFTNGLIAFSAGKNPTRVRFLLPITLTDDHISEIFGILRKTLVKHF